MLAGADDVGGELASGATRSKKGVESVPPSAMNAFVVGRPRARSSRRRAGKRDYVSLVTDLGKIRVGLGARARRRPHVDRPTIGLRVVGGRSHWAQLRGEIGRRGCRRRARRPGGARPSRRRGRRLPLAFCFSDVAAWASHAAMKKAIRAASSRSSHERGAPSSGRRRSSASGDLPCPFRQPAALGSSLKPSLERSRSMILAVSHDQLFVS